MGYLILVRHGKSDLKPDNRFVGWMDVPLSSKGIEEAIDCAVKLKDIERILLLSQTLLGHRKLFSSYCPGRKKQEFLSMKRQMMKAG